MESSENNNEQLTQEIIDTQLKECQIQRDEWKERSLRISADFENYKKRTDKEKLLWMQTAQQSVLLDMLTIIDDFDRAFQAQSNVQEVAGFQLIYKELQKLLEKYGIKEMPTTKIFDPLFHEAIMQVESPEHASGEIVSVLQKGYMIKDQILRPAKVSVAK